MIGSARVTALSDGSVPINLHELLRGMTSARIDEALARNYLSNPVEASINAFLIETGSRRILVDTGAGALFGPGLAGHIPQSLRAAGVNPEQIDDILITHVHTDHSGGLVVVARSSIPTPPFTWASPMSITSWIKPTQRRPATTCDIFDEALATVKPYVDAGKVRTFDTRSEILPGIVAEPRRGIRRARRFLHPLQRRARAWSSSAMSIHAAAVQFPVPTVTITFDQDQARARETRLQAFSQFASNGTLIAAPHLSFPGVGHIRAEGSGYRWVPVAYGDRKDTDAKLDAAAREASAIRSPEPDVRGIVLAPWMPEGGQLVVDEIERRIEQIHRSREKGE